MFGKADGDRDGSISRAEFDEAAKNSPMSRMMQGDRGNGAFGSIDSDRNGALSEEEMSAFGDKMKEKMQGMMGGMTGGGQPADFTKALNAYKQGSSDNTDLAPILMKALDDGNNATSGRGKTA